jgi:hypothetical protein
MNIVFRKIDFAIQKGLDAMFVSCFITPQLKCLEYLVELYIIESEYIKLHENLFE